MAEIKAENTKIEFELTDSDGITHKYPMTMEQFQKFQSEKASVGVDKAIENYIMEVENGNTGN